MNIFRSCMSKKVVEKVVEPKPLPPKRKNANKNIEEQEIKDEETIRLCDCFLEPNKK